MMPCTQLELDGSVAVCVCVCVCIGVLESGVSFASADIPWWPMESVFCDYQHDLCLYRTRLYMADLLYNMLVQRLICVFLPNYNALGSGEASWRASAPMQEGMMGLKAQVLSRTSLTSCSFGKQFSLDAECTLCFFCETTILHCCHVLFLLT